MFLHITKQLKTASLTSVRETSATRQRLISSPSSKHAHAYVMSSNSVFIDAMVNDWINHKLTLWGELWLKQQPRPWTGLNAHGDSGFESDPRSFPDPTPYLLSPAHILSKPSLSYLIKGKKPKNKSLKKKLTLWGWQCRQHSVCVFFIYNIYQSLCWIKLICEM